MSKTSHAPFMVIKKDGHQEPFYQEKLRASLMAGNQSSSMKDPITDIHITFLAACIQRDLEEYERPVHAEEIRNDVIASFAEVDEFDLIVSYITALQSKKTRRGE